MESAARAVEDIRKLGKMMKGIIELSSDLEELGSLERLGAELKAQSDRARNEAASLQADLEQSRQALASNEAQCEEDMNKSREFSEQLIAGANVKSKEIIEVATEYANEIVDKAKQEAETIRSGIVQANDMLAMLNTEIENRKSTVADLDARLADIRSKVS